MFLLLTLWKVPDNAALEDRPKPLNRIRVDRSDNILTLGVIDDTMGIFPVEFVVAGPCVGARQADFLGYRAFHKGGKRPAIDRVDDARHDITLALDGSDDWRFAGADAASPAALAAFVFVLLVLSQAANECFVNFYYPDEFY